MDMDSFLHQTSSYPSMSMNNLGQRPHERNYRTNDFADFGDFSQRPTDFSQQEAAYSHPRDMPMTQTSFIPASSSSSQVRLMSMSDQSSISHDRRRIHASHVTQN